MIATWQTRNLLLIAVAGLIAASTAFAPGRIAAWLIEAEPLEQTDGSKGDSGTVKPAEGTKTTLTVSDEEIQRAAHVPLHRMQPPKPLPPPEPVVTPIVVTAEPLFTGSLLGIIEDTNPKYCYAILQLPTNRIRLVSPGESIAEDGTGAILKSVQSESVIVSLGDREQTVALRGTP